MCKKRDAELEAIAARLGRLQPDSRELLLVMLSVLSHVKAAARKPLPELDQAKRVATLVQDAGATVTPVERPTLTPTVTPTARPVEARPRVVPIGAGRRGGIAGKRSILTAILRALATTDEGMSPEKIVGMLNLHGYETGEATATQLKNRVTTSLHHSKWRGLVKQVNGHGSNWTLTEEGRKETA